jgi:hypothetical protein
MYFNKLQHLSLESLGCYVSRKHGRHGPRVQASLLPIHSSHTSYLNTSRPIPSPPSSSPSAVPPSNSFPTQPQPQHSLSIISEHTTERVMSNDVHVMSVQTVPDSVEEFIIVPPRPVVRLSTPSNTMHTGLSLYVSPPKCHTIPFSGFRSLPTPCTLAVAH